MLLLRSGSTLLNLMRLLIDARMRRLRIDVDAPKSVEGLHLEIVSVSFGLFCGR